MNYSVEAGSVKARVPVVIFRNKLAERTTYYLRLEIVENDFFKTGVKTELHRTVVFSKDLLKPAGWGGYLESVVRKGNILLDDDNREITGFPE